MQKVEKTMDLEEAIQRLNTIDELCITALANNRPMLIYDFNLLNRIHSIATRNDEVTKFVSQVKQEVLKHVIISCSTISINDNQTNNIAVATVIEYKNEAPIEFARKLKNCKTKDQGDYDAIYMGLTQLMALKNNPGCEIEIRSDNKLVVDQLNNKLQFDDQILQEKYNNIINLIKELPVPVSIQWKPRNGTSALEKASYLVELLRGNVVSE